MSLQDGAEMSLQVTVLNRLAVLEALCANQAQTIQSLQDEVISLRTTLSDQVLVTQVDICMHSLLIVTGLTAFTCDSCCQPGQYGVAEEHGGSFASTSGLEVAANYAAQPPIRRPHPTVSVSRASRAEQIPAGNLAIPALHARPHANTSAVTQTPSRLHTLASPASALLPLQREQFVAKLPKACS